MIINLKRAQEVIDQAAQTDKPAYKIKIAKAVKPQPSKPQPIVESDIDEVEIIRQPKSGKKSTSPLSQQCWEDYNQLRIEQAKEANLIHKMDNASKKEIAELYAKVESYRPGLISLYNRARYVDQYGELPPEGEAANDPASDKFLLKDEKRKLISNRSKLQKKIEVGEATNHPKLTEWKAQLDQKNAEYNLVSEQLDRLEGKV